MEEVEEEEVVMEVEEVDDDGRMERSGIERGLQERPPRRTGDGEEEEWRKMEKGSGR